MLPVYSQTAPSTVPGLPKEPREVFAAATPYYDFSDPALKPWHLKSSYQLYNEKGTPSEQGTFEYWWASPKVYRSTWTRPGASRTDWHTPDGEYAYEATGEPLELFEFKLQAALIPPLPKADNLDPSKFHLEGSGGTGNEATGSCITVVPRIGRDGTALPPDQGPFPTYCFDSKKPMLQSVYSYERVLTTFGNIAETQGRFLARRVEVFEGKHNLLSATVDSIDMFPPNEHIFSPSSLATHTMLQATVEQTRKVNSDSGKIVEGFIIKKMNPTYPREAKKKRIQGQVVLTAIIGTDGRTHDLMVVSAPSALLAASSFRAVSQWEYKPYLLDGAPVPVDTTIKVNFALGK